MRSYQVTSNQDGTPQQYGLLRDDARGSSFLLAQQMLGFFSMGTNPTNGKTWTLTINGNAISGAFVTSIGSTPGNVLIGATGAATVANWLAFLQQPQTTTSTGVAFSGATLTLLSYLTYAAPSSGTTLYVLNSNTNLYAPLTSFSASTNATSDSWTSQTMQLYVHAGTVYVNGTRVLWTGGMTPTVTAPSSHPRIDVLAIDNTGTLSWTTGTEAATPSAPTYPANKVPICELYNVVSETLLYDFDNQQNNQGYIYNDVRPLLGTSVNLQDVTTDILPDGDGTRNLGSPSFEFNNVYIKSGIFLNGAAFGSQVVYSGTALESISAGAPVAVGLSQTTNIGYDTSGETSAGGSVTIGTNSNRVLVVVAISENGTAPSGTFAGQTLSFTTDSYTLGATGWRVSTAILVAPPTGSGSFGLSNANVVFYWSLYNCAQASPQDNRATNGQHNVTSSSVSMALNTDGAITVGVMFTNDAAGSIGTAAGNVFNEHTSTHSNPTYAIGESGVSVILPANQAVSLSISGASTDDWVSALVSVKPANAVAEGLINASSASVAAGNTRCTGFIGFAVSTVTASQSLSAVLSGVATSLSGLILGSEYYLNDTNGTIGISPGTNTRKVGVAVSSSKLAVTNVW